MKSEQQLKEEIISLTKEYYQVKHKNDKEYVEGERIHYSGRVFDEDELVNLVDSSLEFWLTAGRYAEKFEKKLAEFLGINHCALVNSGSSANLIAFMALTSPSLGEKRIKKGDEVITVAAGFPTTITPIIQYGAVPVFIDVTIPQYNIDINKLENALTEKTKAIMLAHTLGNPFDLNYIREFCDQHKLWLIEDNCDALGSKYLYKGDWKLTGTIGHISTCSFYPPHHITLGEGGAVCTDDSKLYHIIKSFRDWGRDCWCNPGVDDTCKHRYTQQFGELPLGYDHKYVYSHFGYNLKITDMQAAIGCAQLNKLNKFIEVRKENWKKLRNGLEDMQDKLILPSPIVNSDPSWFGFLMTLKEEAALSRDEFANYLEERNIQTRNLFSGNFIKHPCFDEMRTSGEGYRIIGNLENTDRIMMNSLWIGVYPGMNDDRINYMIKTIKMFLSDKKIISEKRKNDN